MPRYPLSDLWDGYGARMNICKGRKSDCLKKGPKDTDIYQVTVNMTQPFPFSGLCNTKRRESEKERWKTMNRNLVLLFY